MGTAVQATATGRTGRAGSSVPATSRPSPSLPPAGYKPDKLDATIRDHLEVCEVTIRHAQALGKRVEKALERLEGAQLGTAVEEAELVTTLFDRMAKANLNTVKSVDELSRLRSF